MCYWAEMTKELLKYQEHVNKDCLCKELYFMCNREINISLDVPLQAFLELSSEECAQTMVSYYSSVTPVIRNHPIYMQYSTHKELKTDNSPNQVVRAQPDTLTQQASPWWGFMFQADCNS